MLVGTYPVGIQLLLKTEGTSTHLALTLSLISFWLHLLAKGEPARVEAAAKAWSREAKKCMQCSVDGDSQLMQNDPCILCPPSIPIRTVESTST
jgi:hypothetical protein